MERTSMDAEDGQEESEAPVDEPVLEYSESGRYARFNQILGRGAFKTVYKAFDEEEGMEVAWNQVRVSELVSNKEERDRLFAEIRVLKQLKHKNIMTFYDSWLDQKTYCVNFITELFTSGTLRQYRRRHKVIDDEVLKRWAWQILCGLVYLHGHNPPIIHRDLKCDNIFINGAQGVVKIGDLGLATLLRARTAPQSVLGTPEFMAPELYEEEYDDRVDVYSFGMCLLELATLEYPYSECRNAAQIYRKVTLGVRPAALQKVSSGELAEFIAVCIQPKGERPRARQLLKAPYFDSIREKAVRCDAALSATTSQVDMFSDYASMTSSSLSRSSSAAGDMAAAGSMSPTSPRRMADAGHVAPAHSDNVAQRPFSPVAAQQPQPVPLPVLVPARQLSTLSTNLSGSLQSTVESLHAIVETLPGLLAERAAAEGGNSKEDGSLQRSQPQPEREFRVRGKLQEDESNLNLRLRICQPGGPAKTVEFDFDLGADTAMSVATEMVNELSLSHEDARAIATAIGDEIKQLTGKLVEFQRDEEVADDAHEAESLRSSDGVDARGGAHSGPSAMDVDSRGGRAGAPSGSSRQGGVHAAAGRDFSRQPSSRIHHVHFHESGCPPMAAPGARTASTAFPQGVVTVGPGGGAPRAPRPDAGHIGASSSEPSGDLQRMSDSGEHQAGDGVGSGDSTAALTAVSSADRLALLQRVDSHQTIRHGTAAAAGAGRAAAPDEASAAEQGSVVGVKRSNSGVVSPNKEGDKLPLKKLFEEGLPGSLSAALVATSMAPVHALTNGVHATVASIASVAALPFVHGPAASSRVSGGGSGTPLSLSPRAASDSAVEVSAALGDIDAPRTAGVVEPLTMDFGRTAHSAVLPPELRVRLPLPQDACSATMSESGDSQPASVSGGSTPARLAASSHSATAPLLRSVGASGSGNILAAAVRSVSQGNLSGFNGGRGLQPAGSGLSNGLHSASGSLLGCSGRDGAKEAAAEARRLKAAENMRNMERISLQALGDSAALKLLPGKPIGAGRQQQQR